VSQANPTKREIDKYVSHYLLYGCQSSAWRKTFPKSKAKPVVVWEKASKFQKLNKVQLRIQELAKTVREIAEKEFKIDARWVLDQSVKVYNRCMQEEAILVKGKPTGEFKFEAAGANKAVELIGKNISVNAFSEALKVPEEITERSFNDFYTSEK